MSDWKAAAQGVARHLQGNALAGSALTLLLLGVWSAGCAAPLPSLLILVSGLAVLASAAYLLFDAALFRLSRSYRQEQEGLAAIDDVLDRMGLRRRPDGTLPLSDRITGSRRILHAHRIALAIFAVLFAVNVLGEAGRC